MIEKLVEFCTNLNIEKIPQEVIVRAKRCLLDWIGVTLGARRHEAIEIMRRTVEDFGGNGQASILGTRFKTSMFQAALVNGTASHLLDFDDTHLDALMHPSVTVLPAVMAYSEANRLDGRRALVAYLAGFEVATRISKAVGGEHYDAGWHSTATMGRFGAAAAVAKLAGLEPERTAMALGLAGTQASGTRRMFGTMGKSFHAGKAAADGLLSAALVAGGFTAAADIFSGDQGLGCLLSKDYRPERALAGLGQTYNIMTVSLKPFASCLYTHPVIDGVIELRERHQIRPGQVKQIDCRVSRLCADAACQINPQAELARKFSTYFCAALALVEGKAGESAFHDDVALKPQIRELIERVHIQVDPQLGADQAEVVITLNAGQSFHQMVDYPLGDPRKPLSDSLVESKFRDVCGGFLASGQIDSIVAAVMDFENLEDVATLIEQCAIDG